MVTYLPHKAATEYIRSRGVTIGRNQLYDLKSEGRGPHCTKINGRNAYTVEWIDQWIEAEAAQSPKPPAKPPSRRKPRAAARSIKRRRSRTAQAGAAP
jgi:hypothetical protein